MIDVSYGSNRNEQESWKTGRTCAAVTTLKLTSVHSDIPSKVDIIIDDLIPTTIT